jgi:gas vesicle protein
MENSLPKMKIEIELLEDYEDIDIEYPYSEWAEKGILEIYRIKGTSFLIYINKEEWEFRKTSECIRVIWKDLGQVVIKRLGEAEQDISPQKALRNSIKGEIERINSYSENGLKWEGERELDINGIDVLTIYTKCKECNINVDNRYVLTGRISIYLFIYDNDLISLVISGAYKPNPPWGNREPMLRRCIRHIREDIPEKTAPETETEKSKEKENEVYTKTTISATGVKDILTNIKNVETKLDQMNNEMYSKFQDVEYWISDINERINSIFEILEPFRLNAKVLSKITIEEDKE